MQIKSGNSIGIIGSTGVGKSTLVDIILGLLKPTEGQVLVDGKDINIGNNCSDWQNQIGYIPQDIYLIDDTIKRNIAFHYLCNKLENHSWTIIGNLFGHTGDVLLNHF